MHTRIPELHGEDLTRSMGMFAVWWIETFFRVVVVAVLACLRRSTWTSTCSCFTLMR